MSNEFLPFANDSEANVISQEDYAGMAQRLTGFSSGIAQSAQLNKAWRQSSVMAAAVAQFIANTSSVDVKDDGDFGKLVTQLTTALNSIGGGASVSGSVPVRLTLSPGVPIPDGDIGGATTIYMTPYGGNSVPIFNGTIWASFPLNADTSMTLDAPGHVANGNYSVFAFQVAGTVRIGSGPAWSSTTSPGAGAGSAEVEYFQGRLVNRYAITLRNNGETFSVPANQALLVGGFHVAGVAGLVSDTATLRHLSNVYNQYPRNWLRRDDSIAQWTLPQSENYRQANANPANQVEYFRVIGGSPVQVDVNAIFINSTSSYRTTGLGIGLDSKTVDSSSLPVTMSINNITPMPISCRYRGNPGVGFHYLAWLEFAGGTDVRTCYGNGMLLPSLPVPMKSGMIGSVMN